MWLECPWQAFSTPLRLQSLIVLQGGAIASAFHADFPYLVDRKVALISPAGALEAADLSRTSKFMSSALGQMFCSSFLGRVRIHNFYYATNKHSHPSDVSQEYCGVQLHRSCRGLHVYFFPRTPYLTQCTKLAQLQAAYLPGYNAAVGSSIRQGPVRGQQSSFQLLHQSNKSILMVYVRPPPGLFIFFDFAFELVL